MILPLRKQAEIRNTWLSERLNTVLPEVMRREGFDMWIVAAREYNEDPVIMTLLPEPAMSARRRTILVFAFNAKGEFERLSIDRYGHPGFYTPMWKPENEAQFDCLARIVRERDPKTIGLNVSTTFAFSDGLSHNEYELIAAALDDEYMGRTRSAERVCVGWLERRIAAEMSVYPDMMEQAHRLIAEAFNSRVIRPGTTTTDDVVWWFRQRMHDLGLRAWFQPSVEIQALGKGFDAPAPGMDKHAERKVIMEGDLLHCDVGFMYLGLATDHQQHAYILKSGETDAPQGLKDALADGNRLQDILMNEMKVGRTGNQVLRDALEQSNHDRLIGSIYSHPLGYHGHAAGPTIGLWDQHGGVPGLGDYELFDDTCYSIELNVQKAVPEWNNQVVRIALEEDAVQSGGQMRWLSGRQTQFHLIKA
jgi:hypothetical protein